MSNKYGFMTGREIHKLIEKIIPDYLNADLYFDAGEFQVYSKEDLKTMIDRGCISLDSLDGHERYYENV